MFKSIIMRGRHSLARGPDSRARNTVETYGPRLACLARGPDLWILMHFNWIEFDLIDFSVMAKRKTAIISHFRVMLICSNSCLRLPSFIRPVCKWYANDQVLSIEMEIARHRQTDDSAIYALTKTLMRAISSYF